jgi:nucleotide-binding universal stress UspA family protein
MQEDTHPHGDKLLIAMSNTKGSLDMVHTVAQDLADPPHSYVTLMHYLMPIYWEHGGDTANEREMNEIIHEEEQMLRTEERQEERSRDFFLEGKKMLTDAGVPADHISTHLTTDGVDVAHAVLQEVEGGSFTTVVVGERDRGFLEQVFSSSVADFLKNHTHNGTALWVVPEP